MKSPLLSLMLIFSLIDQSFCQQKNTKKIFACNYFGRNISPQEICPQMQGFVSDSHAEQVIGQFAKKMGQFHSKFRVMQCSNTDNCFATVIEGQPYIIYDNAFLNRVEETTRTDWAAVSILAHEIGHHANFHTIDGTGSRPDKELEADYFSGFWLHEMGANLAQSQEAMKHFQGEYVTSTHPPRSQRLDAIEKGWKEAENLHPKLSTIPQKLPTNIPPRTESRVIIQPEAKVYQRKPEVIEKDIEIENISTANKTGCISGDCANGNGYYVHPTQGSYKGGWRNGKRDGFGTHYYANGQKMYVGEYALGKRHGSGTYYFPDGERFEGRFVNDRITQKGKYILREDDDREEIKLPYIFSDGKREIIKIISEEEEEE